MRHQICEPRGLKSFILPVDLHRRVTPLIQPEYVAVSFDEFPVEGCIMREDDICTINDFLDCIPVNLLAFDHTRINTDDFGDLIRDFRIRLLQALERLEDFENLPFGSIPERYHREFNDLVPERIEACYLKVKKSDVFVAEPSGA
jgi:hypothetical protein